MLIPPFCRWVAGLIEHFKINKIFIRSTKQAHSVCLRPLPYGYINDTLLLVYYQVERKTKQARV